MSNKKKKKEAFQEVWHCCTCTQIGTVQSLVAQHSCQNVPHSMGKMALNSMQMNKHVHQSFSIAMDECHLQKKCVYFDVSSQRMFHFFEERQVEPLASWLFAELSIAGSQLSYKSGPISAKVLWLGWQGEKKKKNKWQSGNHFEWESGQTYL